MFFITNDSDLPRCCKDSREQQSDSLKLLKNARNAANAKAAKPKKAFAGNLAAPRPWPPSPERRRQITIQERNGQVFFT